MRFLTGAAVAALLAAAPASAAEFTFVHTGAFSAADALTPAAGGDDRIGGQTDFRLTARLDDTSLNLVSLLPFPPFITQGWVAYRPFEATFTIGGVDYAIDPSVDFAVTIWDQTNFFFPGAYGAGWIVEADLPPPVGDGPGIIGDWLGATDDFLVDGLVTTTFTGYRGAGFAGEPGCEVGACVQVPLALVGPGGESFLLQLVTRVEEFAQGAPLQTAVLIPAPGALALFGLGALALAARRRM